MKTRISSLIGVVLLVALVGATPPGVSAKNNGDVRPDVSIITLPTTITQDFNTLPATGSVTWTNNSTLTGWYHARTGTGTTIVANDGAINTGNFYSYGTGTNPERALGSVGSGTAGDMFWGILLTNNTGATINTLNVSYTGEQWRNSAAAAQTAAFSYLIGTGLTGSLAEFQTTGVVVPSLDFTSPITGGTAGALDGNLAANRVVRTFSITGLSVGNGQDIMLRWSDPDHGGADHGLAIDDFSVTASSSGGPTPTPGVTPTPSPTVTATPSVTPGPIRIRDIQGAAHLSPRAGQVVANIPGIVTAKVSNGFYLQDPTPDANDATSEGIFVFTSTAPTVNAGDSVLVGGTVTEFRPGGSGTTNLTTTEISSPTVTLQSTGNPLPAPTVLGTGGRIPPSTVIEDDAAGSVETSGVFDPATDGIDFYESLEGMRVQVNNAVVIGPRSDQGEIPVLSDDGANASVRTTRGGIVVRSTDFNPERIILDDLILATPVVHVGDHFSGPAIGVMDYGFGNFKLLITQALTAVSGGLARETTATPTASQLAVATFNVENLDPGDPPAKFTALASLIINNLRSPDIIAVEEIQDNNGPTNDAVVDATTTYNTLIAAIQAAGGPTYLFRQINPVDDQDGGEPGGNIRVGFLFRTDRGLAFTDRAGGCSTCATTVANGPSGVQLSFSPGRIDPTNSAFNASRKPLAGEFTFNSQKLFLIANHFNSKGGDDPLFGRFQPPVLSSETQRTQQAQIVNNFVDSILALNANAKIVVLGDLNDFSFSTPMNTLKGGVLHALIETLPQAERYTYVFEGNSQDLDHILLSDGLFSGVFNYDVVHVNAEFADQISDHDPQVVRLTLTGSVTPTPTIAPSATPTATATATATGTVPPTPSPTPTFTATPPLTPTPTPTCPPNVIQGFDDITNLPVAGWVQTNHSATIGTTGWFQGNDAIFPAHQGTLPNSYIGANFNNTTGTNTISNWLLTPATMLRNAIPLTFWTRTTTANPFPDRLQVRMSTNGASTNVGTTATDVGDFTTLLLDINPTYTVGGYPEVWTQMTVTITGVPSSTLGRLAFRYFVENGGPTGDNSNYIGIDTVSYVTIACDDFASPTPSPTATPTPTPTPTVTPCLTTTTFGWAGVAPIPDSPGGTPPAYGTPLVISFEVSGITSPLVTVSTSVALTHPWVGDLDMVLAAPGGSPSLITVSRIGVTTAGSFGDSSNYMGMYSFTDSTPGANIWTVATLPGCDDTCQVGPTFYRTTEGGMAGQTNPPPVTSLNATFGGLTPAQANGTWTLTIRDGGGGNTGTVTVANIILGTACPGSPTPTPTATPTVTVPPTATPTPSPTPTLSPGITPSPTPIATPTPTSAAQAVNLSTRMRVQTGENVGIGGFIISGTAPKHVLVRGIGPSLTAFGVPNALADPVLELHGPGSFTTVINNNWQDDPAQAVLIQATGLAPTNTLESAIDATVNPGQYTAIVRGNNNAVGVGLIEVYDLSQNVAAKLANISTRAFVSTGDDIVIAGFLLGNNNGTTRIVIRGIGGSLTVFGVANALANPTLELRDENAAILASNDNWQDDAGQAAELTAAGLAPTNNLESGIAINLGPGQYTALLSGVGNATGVGVVEVYDRGP